MGGVIVIDIGGSRETLLKLANDINSMFAGDGELHADHTLYGRENNLRGVEVQIRFSNDDMEDRDDVPVGAVFVDVENAE